MKTTTLRTKRKSAKQGTADFSFAWDALRYAKKDQYVANDLAFAINALEFQPGRGYQGTDRWAAFVSPSDGRPDEIITLPTNEKRNAQLQAAKAQIKTRGPIPNLRLVKVDGTFYFRPAEPRGS